MTAELVWFEVTAARATEFFRTIRERIAAECEAELNSIVYSDGWKAYNKLSLNGFHHRRINHDKLLVDGKVPINDFRGYTKHRLKPTTTASSAASGCLSGSWGSDSTIATTKTPLPISGAVFTLFHH
ncbi:MAG: hypothetical protein GF399_12580 [Candidatus Coatesbacteria bacterium]|nr:hypothetical protein [Candidatus Coatesbacteria bacterium]